MSLLSVSGISKRKDDDFVLRDISFKQEAFENVAIAGETGSGKSTLLKIIAGLIQPDEGKVMFENERVLGPNEKLLPGHPRIGCLSQHFELRNNYRVEEELSYTNKLTDEAAETIYEVCQIDHLLKRKTDQLSGGEKQRIATARLLIAMPKLLLLDEPFSNLDIAHKNMMKQVIHDIGERLKITCMLVSHDPADTLSWADKILIMKGGEVIQTGKPYDIYHTPVSEYAGALFGSYNIISPALAARFGDLLPNAGKGDQQIIRPEKFSISNSDEGLQGTVTKISFFGSYFEIAIEIEEHIVLVRQQSCDVSKGDIVYVTVQR